MKKTGVMFLLVLLLIGCASSEAEPFVVEEIAPLTHEEAYDTFLDAYQDWHVRYFSFDYETKVYTLHGHMDGVEVIVEIDKENGSLQELVVRDLKNYRDETDITRTMILDIASVAPKSQSFELFKQHDLYVLNIIEKGLSYNIKTQEALDD